MVIGLSWNIPRWRSFGREGVYLAGATSGHRLARLTKHGHERGRLRLTL